MHHYIKTGQRITRNKACSFTPINSKNPHITYNKRLLPEFVIGSPTFIETINFSIGTNIHTKPYKNIL